MTGEREKIRAFEEFFKENYSFFYFTAYHLLDNEELSRDMVSECVQLVWEHCRNGDVREWKAYMYHAIRNRCVDHIRHQAVKKRYVEFYKAVTPESYEEYHEDDERVQLILSKMETLPPLARQVLHMCYFQKKKYREVALELGISMSYVKKLIITALSQLRKSTLADNNVKNIK
ncbi:MAG: sigma-70 family RNA polymerase sigma factor [Muribaculaceae bacterium]|nr:sigma-70 family RNA polymerase sigma factor [Muribaculaceae bacterium]